MSLTHKLYRALHGLVVTGLVYIWNNVNSLMASRMRVTYPHKMYGFLS